MTEEKIREFSLRISQTSRTGLVAITDEIIITYIEDAKKALGENDKEAFLFNIGKAKQFVDDLSSSLDMRFEISYELQRLYSFIRGRLIIAEGRENAEYLDVCIEMLEKLKSAFEKVAQSDHSGNVIQGSQKVYAGLTYGPGSTLNEVVFHS